MAASSKLSRETSLDLSESSLRKIDSMLRTRKGIELEVTAKVNSGQQWLLSIPGFGKLHLFVEVPRHSRIPQSQIQSAATLFFGSLLSYLAQSKTPELLAQSSSIASNYTVMGNLGRPLFGSIAAVYSMWEQEDGQKQGHVDPLIEEMRAEALRVEVVYMIVMKKPEVATFADDLGINDPKFRAYCTRMMQRGTLGGELEILMASHVLKKTIRVFRVDEKTGDILLIAEYGKDMYGIYRPVNLLYKGRSASNF